MKPRILQTHVWETGLRCHYCGVNLLMPETPKIAPYYKIRGNESVLENGFGILHYDHKIPLSKGGSVGVDNLVEACRVCNAEKSDMDYDAYIFKKLANNPSPEFLLSLPGRWDEYIKQAMYYAHRRLFAAGVTDVPPPTDEQMADNDMLFGWVKSLAKR